MELELIRVVGGVLKSQFFISYYLNFQSSLLSCLFQA